MTFPDNPEDESVKLPHAFVIATEPGPIFIADGTPVTRRAAVRELLRLRDLGKLTAPSAELISFETIKGKKHVHAEGVIKLALPVPGDGQLSRAILRASGYPVPGDEPPDAA